MAAADSGYRRLAVAVLERAYLDRYGTNARERAAAEYFWEHDTTIMAHWCRLVSTPPNRLRACSRTPPKPRLPFPGSRSVVI